mmetsp:Transcript_16768/g.46858  ORF Transcript_16768/g.46858 Transcript_16768/m.46858 type:complete len:237 (+) Transcript_16768:359-1069(+)
MACGGRSLAGVTRRPATRRSRGLAAAASVALLCRLLVLPRDAGGGRLPLLAIPGDITPGDITLVAGEVRQGEGASAEVMLRDSMVVLLKPLLSGPPWLLLESPDWRVPMQVEMPGMRPPSSPAIMAYPKPSRVSSPQPDSFKVALLLEATAAAAGLVAAALWRPVLTSLGLKSGEEDSSHRPAFSVASGCWKRSSLSTTSGLRGTHTMSDPPSSRKSESIGPSRRTSCRILLHSPK